ncbi:hypothetical protein GCM10008174_19440 [Methylopila turkensis]|uniref:Uncharacterized protein n=2 Tax=Methylopila turkensis TaxID=1437816 RepID=A0A9W6N762_9HYPH|nr:hypothetical protein GCM10008174_19440 [Methylopila turkensis]
MSMWLSGANAFASAARGLTAAEMRRTQSAMFEEATRQSVAFWTGAAFGAKPAPAKRRARTRKA